LRPVSYCVNVPMLFDQPYYIEINMARWAMAETLLRDVQLSCDIELSTCLDVGCGSGWFSERLSEFGLRVEGLDGRLENFKAAMQRVPGIQFHHVDIESESATSTLRVYDLVFCFGLLYHTENPFRVIRNLRKLTGKLLLMETIVIPGTSPSAWLVSENTNETQGLTYCSLIPTQTCLLKMLECAGFEYVYEYVGPVEHEDFQETEHKHRRRRVFVSSTVPIQHDQLWAAPRVVAPKYRFDKP